MLVLSRKAQESVMIGEDVEVRVVDVRGDKVRLGFVAAANVKIDRKEIFQQIKKENASSAMLPREASGLFDELTKEQRRMETAAHAPFLQAAIDEAMLGLSEGGLPIGSVLVRDGKIIGRGHNRRVQHGDPMAHAEIDCLKNAGRQQTYKDTVLYSTLMPCYLCSGAAVQFGVPKVVVGESITFPGGCCKSGLSPAFMRSAGIEVLDLADQRCIDMMTKFIKENPTLWNEDIGV